MSIILPLSPISSDNLRKVIRLFQDDTIPIEPLSIEYQDYSITHPGSKGPKSLQQFTWTRGSRSELLAVKLSDWKTELGKTEPYSYLTISQKGGGEIVGFSLGLLVQDDFHIYPTFKMGNGEGGKNHWFGKATDDVRTADEVKKLGQRIREVLEDSGSRVIKHPQLPGEWIELRHIELHDSLTDDAAKEKNEWDKNTLINAFLTAFLIAEKLRDESIAAAKNRSVNNTFMHSRNQLLYGPPGTGKTYHTAVRALGILKGLSDTAVTTAYSREQIQQQLTEYRLTGQLEFVTFHQAFSYEDFVEGIKPVVSEEEGAATQGLRYVIERGIFKTLVERSAYALYLQYRQRQAASLPSPAETPLDFDIIFEALEKQWQEKLEANEEVVLKTKQNTELVLQSISAQGTAYFKYRKSSSDNLPQVTRKGLRKINDSNPFTTTTLDAEPEYEVSHGRDRSVYRAVFKAFRELEAQMRAAAGHQLPLASLSLTEALERAVVDPEIAAESIQDFDYKSLTNADLTQVPRFVLIIDEINRGNVANIFGELITLLEADKRAGRSEMLTAKLPYSKATFAVPDNVYLLGTMNTADRSVEALDTALRRRFSFTEMRPKSDIIRTQIGRNGVIGEGEAAIDVAELLDVLNSRLEQLLDHDHTLGHALLLGASSLDGLRTSFEYGIVPLLQEYFFADWGKIGLVLGPKFVEVVKANAPGRHKLAALPGYDAHGLGERPLYRLTAPASWNAQAFQSIYVTT